MNESALPPEDWLSYWNLSGGNACYFLYSALFPVLHIQKFPVGWYWCKELPKGLGWGHEQDHSQVLAFQKYICTTERVNSEDVGTAAKTQRCLVLTRDFKVKNSLAWKKTWGHMVKMCKMWTKKTALNYVHVLELLVRGILRYCKIWDILETITFLVSLQGLRTWSV